MARRRQREQTIFFPWERGRGLFRARGVARARPFAAAIAMGLLMLLLGARERHKAGVRSTQATIGVVSNAVDAYRADHEGRCPANLPSLVPDGYLGVAPFDAWGHPVRLICPGRRDPRRYDLMSDGPDGVMGGLDRVE